MNNDYKYCNCKEYVPEEKQSEYHDPEYIMTLKLGEDNDIWVDIIDTGDTFQSWIYRKELGIKYYMFALPKIVHFESGGVRYFNRDDYIDIVRGTFETYLKDYDEIFEGLCRRNEN